MYEQISTYINKFTRSSLTCPTDSKRFYYLMWFERSSIYVKLHYVQEQKPKSPHTHLLRPVFIIVDNNNLWRVSDLLNQIKRSILTAFSEYGNESRIAKIQQRKRSSHSTDSVKKNARSQLTGYQRSDIRETKKTLQTHRTTLAPVSYTHLTLPTIYSV